MVNIIVLSTWFVVVRFKPSLKFSHDNSPAQLAFVPRTGSNSRHQPGRLTYRGSAAWSSSTCDPEKKEDLGDFMSQIMGESPKDLKWIVNLNIWRSLCSWMSMVILHLKYLKKLHQSFGDIWWPSHLTVLLFFGATKKKWTRFSIILLEEWRNTASW